jgi:hypothetical protein
MTADPGIRASDEDRGRIAAALGEHYAAGRLTLEEFQQRLDNVYAATTLGELDDLMADLPGRDLGQLPGRWLPSPGGNPPLPRPRLPGPVQRPVGGSSLARPAAWRFWLAISIGVFVIWLLSGPGGAPWLLWAALALGLVTLRRWTAGGPHRGGPHRGGPHRGGRGPRTGGSRYGRHGRG